MDKDDLVERLERYGKGEHVGSWRADTFREAAAEIRSLREQVAQERAGIVRCLRETPCGMVHGSQTGWIADAIERHEDKEPAHSTIGDSDGDDGA